MKDLKILVLGAGGIGGYFGGRLTESAADVTFLVREKRRDQLKQDGLRIESQFGNAKLDVKTATAKDLKPEFDIVLLTCKAYDLSAAVEAIRPGLAPSGAVLPLLNGIAHVDALNQAFGKDRVLGGVAKIQVTLAPEGIVRQLNDWRFVTFGEQNGDMTDRVQSLLTKFKAARGVEAEAVPDIMQRMWEKIVHLSTAAAMTCLMRASVGEIVRTPEGRGLFVRLLDTVAEIAAHNGYRPSEEFMASYRKTFSQADSEYTTSMLRDIERRGSTEGDHIIGFMLESARAAGLDDTILMLAHTHVRAYEQRLAAGRF